MSKDSLTKNKEPLIKSNDFTLKFFKTYSANNTVYKLALLPSIYRYLEEKNVKYVQLGIDEKNQHLFINFNNDNKGYSLMGKKYKDTIKNKVGITQAFLFLQKKLINLKSDTPYTLKKIDELTFKINININDDDLIDKESIKIDWLEKQGQFRHTGVRLNNLTLKFIGRGNSTGIPLSYGLYLSRGLLSYIKEKEITYMEFGVHNESRELLVRFSNYGNGISLINKEGNYPDPYMSATGMYYSVKEKAANFRPEFLYELIKVEDNIFRLVLQGTNNIKLETSDIELNDKKVEWLTKKPARKRKRRKDKRFKFVNQGAGSSYGLYLSSGLVSYIKEKEMTYMEFGLEKESGALIIKLNNTKKGISILNRKGDYIKNKVPGTSLYHSLKEEMDNLQLDNFYDLTVIEDHLVLTNSKDSKKLTDMNIKWLTIRGKQKKK